MTELKKSASAVQAALDAANIACVVQEFPASTRTAKDAAAAIGCEVAQIAKSIVFAMPATGGGVMVVASGSNRIDEARIAAIVGEPLGKATPDLVRTLTGYAIGGVPPVGHVTAIPIVIDEDLLSLDEIWAAAGTPNAVFRLTPAELVQLTGGTISKVSG